ncbi:DeoR family transcriptional regulator [Mycolicibacterium fortuitum]|uniref:DeoR family transcriptional regulator n=1 Tax=Mycolicibacterium fortuitum TaxID=1766 RepID=UPI0014901806|nr:DeoR/GlpR transcriptional regulator [Mycolicibacterium fortuitum]
MAAELRQREILRRVNAEGYVEAKALADQLRVDISTVRRDLDALARTGQVRRTHGGARPVSAAVVELPYAIKQAENRAQKRAIGLAAAGYVKDGDTVILDSGSTTYEIAEAIQHRTGVTVIANDLRICKFVATVPRLRLLVTGGELLESVFTLVGEKAVRFFDDYTADVTFLGADAVDARAGITNTNTAVVPVKRAMIAAAETTVLVADSSKFGHRALAKVAGLDEIDSIVTDDGLSANDADLYPVTVSRVRPTESGSSTVIAEH